MKKNLLIAAVVIVTIIVLIFAPKGTVSNLFTTAGGGINLKEMNRKDTTDLSVNMTLQANQTTNKNLEQGLVCGNYFFRQNGYFIGGSFVGGVSTEYGVCTPVMFMHAGYDFKNFRVEYKVGNFKRSTISSCGTDPQYSNHCIDLGEGASSKNAMQLSLIKGSAKFGFGHQGIETFYSLNEGFWYAYAEAPVCKNLLLSGGVDFCEKVTGYAAAQLTANNNCFVVTANQIGTEKQNLIATFTRNFKVKKNQMLMTVSAWAQESAQGLHVVAGLVKGKGTFYAELGSNYCTQQYSPYFGVGTSFNF